MIAGIIEAFYRSYPRASSGDHRLVKIDTYSSSSMTPDPWPMIQLHTGNRFEALCCRTAQTDWHQSLQHHSFLMHMSSVPASIVDIQRRLSRLAWPFHGSLRSGWGSVPTSAAVSNFPPNFDKTGLSFQHISRWKAMLYPI